MSTILDALKKVERERESPREQLRHAPEPEPKHRRRVSTTTILVCALLGFGVGAGIALWRSAPPPEELARPAAPSAVAPAPGAAVARDEVPADAGEAALEGARPEVPEPAGATAVGQPATKPERVAKRPHRPSGVASRPQVAAAAPPAPADVIADNSALEPSPFKASSKPEAGTAVAASAPPSAEPLAGRLDQRLAALPEVAEPEAEPATGTIDDLGSEPKADLPANVAALPEEAEPAPGPPTIIDTGRSPPGAPRVTLSFLQWSAEPGRRFAFISIDGAPSQRVQEGDTAGGVSVARITPTGVELKHEDKVFIIRPRH
jgi:hypothetical protein